MSPVAKYLILVANLTLAEMELRLFVLFFVISTAINPNNSSKSSVTILRNFYSSSFLDVNSARRVSYRTRSTRLGCHGFAQLDLFSVFCFLLIAIQKQLPELFCKKVWDLQLFQKEILAQVFSCDIYEIFKNTFLAEHLLMTASGYC